MSIKTKRTSANMTQQELADMLGIDRTTVTKWETGACMPSIKMLRLLSNILGCTIDELLGAEAESA
jgi:transcriptional regulator with XRE-family HTH domain